MIYRVVSSHGYSTLLYVCVGLLVLGPIVVQPFAWTLGGPGDPQQFIWYLGWFWYAISHGHNPLYTTFLNAPLGQNLMWNTSILAESFVFGPLTFLFNGTFMYNLLWLVNFVLSCCVGRRIFIRLGVRSGLSMLGGSFMGLLPYTTSQSLFHLHLWMTSIVLTITYLLLVGMQSNSRMPLRFGMGLGLLAAVEFYTSIEVFATMLFVGVCMMALGLILMRKTFISYVCRLRGRTFASACLVTFALALPGLWEMFLGAHRPHGALLGSGIYVNDLLNFVVPTLVYLVHFPLTNSISAHYTGNFWENNGYLGLPAIVMLVWSAKRLWHLPMARVAVFGSCLVILFSMGPTLHIDGTVTHVWLPWSLIGRIPLLDSALPSRLMMYADVLNVILLICAVEDFLREPGHSRKVHGIVMIGLILTTVTWLPRIPYPRTKTPAAARALTTASPLYPAMVGQRTYILTPFFPQTMQMIEQAGYPVAIVNPYGYTDNDAARSRALRMMDSILVSNLPAGIVRARVLEAATALHATRIMYCPIHDDDHLTKDQMAGLTAAFGKPVAASQGALVWSTTPFEGKTRVVQVQATANKHILEHGDGSHFPRRM